MSNKVSLGTNKSITSTIYLINFNRGIEHLIFEKIDKM